MEIVKAYCYVLTLRFKYNLQKAVFGGDSFLEKKLALYTHISHKKTSSVFQSNESRVHTSVSRLITKELYTSTKKCTDFTINYDAETNPIQLSNRSWNVLFL